MKMSFSFSVILHKLSRPTTFFGLKLWLTIVIFVVIAMAFVTISALACKSWRHGKNRKESSNHAKKRNLYGSSSMDRRLLSRDLEMSIRTPEKHVMYSEDLGSDGRIDGDAIVKVPNMAALMAMENSGPIEKFTLTDVESATNGLADENVIGRGNHGVVYQGYLMGNDKIAVKKFFSNRSPVMNFVKEAEAMCLIRHKNLVKLVGYCAEGTHRILVTEYVDNGNLKQWLHHCISNVSPLTWNIRMKIIIGIAKGLAYLHEDTEPSVVHRNLKSSNILLDKQWNPKISDFGITKLLGPEWNHLMATPTGMSGYIAPEYAGIHRLNEKSDVYSFGILIMEIITGKTSTHSTINEIEEYLVDWIKTMVAEQKLDLILDPNLPEFPTSKELKRIVLIALRCVDSEVEERPQMSQIIHMLEPRDLLLSDDKVIKRQISRRNYSKEDLNPKHSKAESVDVFS